MLWLEARVMRDGFFPPRRAATGDDFGQRFVRGETPQAASLPFPQVLGHGLLTERLAEQHPGFVSAFRRDAHFREFLFGVLRAVAATKAEVEPNDGGANFVTRLGHRSLDVMLENGMTGDANVRAGNKRAE